MRTLGVAIVTVALLAGTAPGVLAQEEEEAPTSSLVTGRVLRDTSPQDDWQEVWVDGNVVHVLGWRVERVVDWSDPRLPTSMLSRGNVDTHLAESGLVQTYAETYRLDGPKGAWTGTGRALAMEHGSDPVWLMVLHGEGVYDGLSAMLVRETVRADPGSGDLDHTVMKGSILEGGLPAMPSPKLSHLLSSVVTRRRIDMRILCVSVITVALLVASATGAAAQTEEDGVEPILSTYVTGKVLGEDHSNADSPLLKSEWLIEWSDPRLPSEMASHLHLIYAPVPDPAVPRAHVYRLDGPDGAWAGMGRGFSAKGRRYEVIALTGEGAYEGLSAMLGWKPDEAGKKPKLEGYIFEFPLPDFPRPIEPAAE